MLFANWPNKILYELGVERPQTAGPTVIDWISENTALSNKTVIFMTPALPFLKEVTTPKRSHSKTKVSSFRKRNLAE